MHPVPYEALIEYAAEETNAAELARVSSHVQTCAECTNTVNHFRNIRSISGADDWFNPPAAAVARAQAIFVARREEVKWGLPAAFPLRVVQAAAALVLIVCLLFTGVGITLASRDIPADSPLYPLKVTILAIEKAATGIFAPPVPSPTAAPTITSSPAPTPTTAQEQATPTPVPSQIDVAPILPGVQSSPEKTPPGQEKTPPGQEKTPPGLEKTPPGQEKTPPGLEKTPPGQEKTPPGQVQTPPGQVQTPPGQSNDPPGQDKQPPGQDKQPPGQDKPPPGQNKPPPGPPKK
jgi:hypothetical protein